MGRPKTSGLSHNKNASTYESKRNKQTSANRQMTLFDMMKKKPEEKRNEERKAEEPEECTSGASRMSETESDNSSMKSLSDVEDNETMDASEYLNFDGKLQASKDGRSYLQARQAQEHWETEYPFAFFSAKENGWLCKVCLEYGEGAYWRTSAVRLWEHPNRVFLTHQNSKQHSEATKKRHECKKMLSKGNIYGQMVKGGLVQKQSTKARNRRVIKKLLKTTYFVVRKNWAVRENFEDIVEFIRDLGDNDISEHLRDSSSRATYTSVATVDEFLKCMSEHLDGELCTRIVAASDFSLLADETTDMADRAVLSVFIRYVDSDTCKVREEYLGLVEIIGSKGAEALCQKICEILIEKGIEVTQLRFHGLDGTNTMSGEISGLQRRLKHKVPHSKYVNCRNHRLSLVFVHLMPKFKNLSQVDANLLAI